MQLFKNNIPPSVDNLYNLLIKVCIIYHLDNVPYYLFDINSYKKGQFYDYFEPFISECRPFYYKSKTHYCDRAVTYNGVVTIFRQICHHHKISFITKMLYCHSDYVNACLFPVNYKEDEFIIVEG
jgi:hypothetical protein